MFPEPLTPRPASRSAFSVVVQSKKENRGRRDWIGGGGSREHTISPQPISPTLLQAPSLDRKPAIYKCTTDGWISQRRAWQPTPVFLAGESHGQRSLAGYSPWGHKESGTTEQLTLSQSHAPQTALDIFSDDEYRWLVGQPIGRTTFKTPGQVPAVHQRRRCGRLWR